MPLNKKLSPSEYVKEQGLDSLAELVRISEVSEQTLINWYKNKPRVFELITLGAIQYKAGKI